MALQQLVDCLNDNREEIRNDLLVVLLLLVEQYPDIANFIAFQVVFAVAAYSQDGFDMLFQIIAAESGVVKRDCLKMVYFIMHKNLVTMKLLSQRSHCC